MWINPGTIVVGLVHLLLGTVTEHVAATRTRGGGAGDEHGQHTRWW
ncbi:hypothetical protein [Streptomyces sp. NPDC050564]